MSIRNRVIVVIAVVALIAAVLAVTRYTGTYGGIKAAFDAELLARPEYERLMQTYELEFNTEPMQMDPGLMYRALAEGAVDVIDGFATDGRIPAYNLVILEDDKGAFPPYYAAPVVRADTLKKYPELKGVLNLLAGKLPDKTMRRLNYEVDEKGRKAYTVALSWLVQSGLVKQDAKPKEAKGPVTVGSKAFTEQEIIGEMMSILIERNTDIEVDRRLNLGGTMICFNALKAGDLDLYAEYTGTALVNVLKREVMRDPEKTYKLVKKQFEKDYDLVFLLPFGFNNTYTLTMRKEHAKELGIKTISDLARYTREH